MHNNTPMVELLYRRNLGMNIANEKTTTEMVDMAAKETAAQTGTEFAGYSFHSDYSTNPPRYCMVAEPKGDVDEETRQKMIETLDELMKGYNEKYFKYRRWGMLSAPEVLILEHGTYDAYKEFLRSKGTVPNQVKPVVVLNTNERRNFFLGHSVTKSSAVDAWFDAQEANT